MKTKLIFFTAAALALAACSNDEPAANSDSDKITPNITANIGWNQSRAYNATWEDGDKIGINATSNGETKFTNICYQTDGAENFSHLGSADTEIFFQDAQDVNFTAYYPFTGSEGTSAGVINGSTSDQARQKEFDYLYAPAYVANLANPNVRLNFSHKMTRLVMKIAADDNTGYTVDDLKDASYSIHGLKLTGTFNTSTGEAKATGSTVTEWEISAFPETGDNVLIYNLVLFPQENAYLVFYATVNNQSYMCEISPTLASGKSYTYTITLKKTGAAASNCSVSDCTITNWDEDIQDPSLATSSQINTTVIGGRKAIIMRRPAGTKDSDDYVPGLCVATCNIGAEKPEDYGLYFWWGDITGHVPGEFRFHWDNNDIFPTYKSTDELKSAGYIDDTNNLTLLRDAAYKKWGDSWHLPSSDDINWLLNTENCSWIWTSINGINGYKIISKQTEGEIFLPANGYIDRDTNPRNVGTEGTYWTTLNVPVTSGTGSAYILNFNSGSKNLKTSALYHGQAIRPVARI